MKPKVHRGKLNAEGFRFAIVVSRWNDFLTSKLLDGAVDGLESLGASEDSVEVFWVPGSFELPSAAKRIAQTGRFDAIIALGVVIRGETAHFDYVAGEAAKVGQVSMETDVPVMFGVVTAETLAYAVPTGLAGDPRSFKRPVRVTVPRTLPTDDVLIVRKGKSKGKEADAGRGAALEPPAAHGWQPRAA